MQSEEGQGRFLFLFTFVVIILTHLLVGSSLSIEWKDCCVINRTTRRLLLLSTIRLGVPGTTEVPRLVTTGRFSLGTPPEDMR